MKIRNLLISLLITTTSINLWAQKPERKMSFERLKAMKINFIIEQVDLNTEEESFVWQAFEEHESDVYKKYHKKMRSFRHQTFKKIKEISEEKASETLDSIAYFRNQKEKMDQEFSAKLRAQLTAKQVLEIHIAEEKFHRRMVDRSRKRKKTS